MCLTISPVQVPGNAAGEVGKLTGECAHGAPGGKTCGERFDGAAVRLLVLHLVFIEMDENNIDEATFVAAGSVRDEIIVVEVEGAGMEIKMRVVDHDFSARFRVVELLIVIASGFGDINVKCLGVSGGENLLSSHCLYPFCLDIMPPGGADE